jgi:hypothetical protein
MLVYPNRMTFDIMPNGGNPPEPTGMLVLRVKSVSDIKGKQDLFSKVRWRACTHARLLLLLLCASGFKRIEVGRPARLTSCCRSFRQQQAFAEPCCSAEQAVGMANWR